MRYLYINQWLNSSTKTLKTIKIKTDKDIKKAEVLLTRFKTNCKLQGKIYLSSRKSKNVMKRLK